MDKSKSASNLIYKFFLGFVALIVLCGLSFYGGIHYQKGKQGATTSAPAGTSSTQNGFAGGFGGRFGGQRPNIGRVTAISSTSITIQDTFDNASKTFSIDSSTQVTNGGQSASLSDIQTGDNVLIRTSSSTSTTASQILINPNFGSGNGGSFNSGVPGST
ncbi:MAG: hypothetical protein ABSD10_00655 [Candidatus Saccharimonadales bacterium]|jgi:hypothetical protein